MGDNTYVKELLDRTKDVPLTEEDVMRIYGFDDEQIRWATIFQEIDFINKKFYLPEFFMRNVLITETSKAALHNFLHRKLERKHAAGVDYEYVPFEHELVQSYRENGNPLHPAGENFAKVTNKRYVIITGQCLIMLLSHGHTDVAKSIMRAFISFVSIKTLYLKYRHVLGLYDVE